jgi:hypothetical protein
MALVPLAEFLFSPTWLGRTAPVFSTTRATVSGSTQVITTSSFTPAANSILITWSWTSTDTRDVVTDSLGGTWTPIVGRDFTEGGERSGWQASYQLIGASPASRTVTFTASIADDHGGAVEEWTGHDATSPIGATSEASFALSSADPRTLAITTQHPNSWVLGGLSNWDNTSASSGDGGGTVIINQSTIPPGGGGCSARRSAATNPFSPVTISINRAGVAERGNICAFELKGAIAVVGAAAYVPAVESQYGGYF